jgi:uncharacterized protein YegL
LAGFNFDEIEAAPLAGLRRLPIYLLLDTSGSMQGAAISSVQRGLEQCVREVMSDTYSRDTIYFGIITFDDDAQLVSGGLIKAADVQVPQLTAGGTTALGKAFQVLLRSLDADVKPSQPGGEKGDYKPLIFVLTDGRPTDSWQGPRQDLLSRQRSQARAFTVITVGCGPAIDEDVIKAIAVNPQSTFKMDDDQASFRKFFQWVTHSVASVSKSLEKPGGAPAGQALPNPADYGLVYIPD